MVPKFKTDPVSNEDVDKILEAARWAPSGFNSQPWEFAVVRDPETREVVLTHLLQYMTPPAKKMRPRESVAHYDVCRPEEYRSMEDIEEYFK